MERVGRLLVDLAPHVAMLGYRATNQQTMISNLNMLNQEFSNYSSSNIQVNNNLGDLLSQTTVNRPQNNPTLNPNISNYGAVGRGSQTGFSIDNQINMRGIVNSRQTASENIIKNMENYTLESRN